MFRILNPKVHGAVDYLAVLAFALAPSVLHLTGTPALLSYLIAGCHLLMTLATAFPLGAFKLIPFPIHGAVEMFASMTLIAIPWLFSFASDDVARDFFVGSGVALFLAWMCTDYEGVLETRRLKLAQSERERLMAELHS